VVAMALKTRMWIGRRLRRGVEQGGRSGLALFVGEGFETPVLRRGSASC
jgi:hypothetical protein